MNSDDYRVTEQYTKLLIGYNALLRDLIDIVGPELNRISANSKQDEPRSPEDAAVLAVIEKLVDAMKKAEDAVKGASDGNN